VYCKRQPFEIAHQLARFISVFGGGFGRELAEQFDRSNIRQNRQAIEIECGW
jgi:hypothetical protein